MNLQDILVFLLLWISCHFACQLIGKANYYILNRNNMLKIRSFWKALDIQLQHGHTLPHLPYRELLEATRIKDCFLVEASLLGHFVYYVDHFVHYVSMRTTEVYRVFLIVLWAEKQEAAF